MVKSLQEVDWSSLKTLIYNDSTDDEVEIVKKVQDLADEDKQIIYINENIDPFLYCIFMGIGADIYDTEDFLQDESVLDFFVSSFKETGMTIATPSKDIEQIAKGIAAISSGDEETVSKLITNKMWLQSLDLSIKNVNRALEIADKVNTNVVAVLQETSAMIESLEKGQDRTTKEIETFRTLLEEMKLKLNTQKPDVAPTAPLSATNSNMFMYGTYNVPIHVPNVLYVKVYGSTRYLLSFLRVFQTFLLVETDSKINSNLLVTIPRLPLLIDKFTKLEMPRLCKDTIGLVDMKSNKEFFTYEPTKDVLDQFFNHNGRQLFIVVDFMYGTDDLLKGNKVHKFAAINGSSDYSTFKLNPENVIVAIAGLPSSITISHIPNFSAKENNKNKKIQLYLKNNAKALGTLMERLGFKGEK